MNIRDVHGFDSPQALYEFVTIKHKLHAGSMDDLIRCVAEIQRRAINSMVAADGPAVLEEEDASR